MADAPELCFGTMSFGGDADEAEAARLYAACREAGVTRFDTAPIYSDGRAEDILGRLVRGGRDAVWIATKAGYGETGARHGDGDAARFTASVEDSLRRLGTDRVDLLYLHRWDPSADLDALLRAVEDLRRAGKALAFGLSNAAAWQVMTAHGRSALLGIAGVDAIQPMYSLVKRQAEVELLPMAEALGMSVFPYSPLGGGLLTGKYATGAGGRLTTNARYAIRYGEDWMHGTAVGLSRLAREAGLHPASLAVAWVAAHRGVTAPILGARSVAQLAPSLAAREIAMTPELRAALSALTRRPPPATDRLEDDP